MWDPIVKLASSGIGSRPRRRRLARRRTALKKDANFLFSEGPAAVSRTRSSDNRSVMPFDVRGRTRATMVGATRRPTRRRPSDAGLGELVVEMVRGSIGSRNQWKPDRSWDRNLQLFFSNQEFPVGASHQLVPTASLPFVHTARRYYRSSVLVRSSDRSRVAPSSRSRRRSRKRSNSGT